MRSSTPTYLVTSVEVRIRPFDLGKDGALSNVKEFDALITDHGFQERSSRVLFMSARGVFVVTQWLKFAE